MNAYLIIGALAFWLWSQRSRVEPSTTETPTSGASSSTSERIRDLTANVPVWGDYL